VLKRRGVKEKAFTTIAAAGKNAAVLHYSENSAKTADGDLILFDLGAQSSYYAADISRTFPVNGKFTDRQKQLYNIVLSGQKKVISAIKPGIPFASLNGILVDFYAKELKKIGLIEKKEDVARYYYHSVGHMLGLETHDIGRSREGVLQKGMVFTVEPGLYIAEEGIGIRIEDDVVVTEKGCDVLSKNIVKTVEEIEALMARATDAVQKPL
jgi:Xaa-Pro aminopeptidase